MVGGLFRCQLGDGRENTEGVAGQHDNVAGLALDKARDLRIGDVFDGVGATSVLCDRDIIVVWLAGQGVVHNVLEDGAETDSVVDIRLLLSREVDGFGIATTLNVEYTGV
jgi:hypothetical protein